MKSASRKKNVAGKIDAGNAYSSTGYEAWIGIVKEDDDRGGSKDGKPGRIKIKCWIWWKVAENN